MSDSMHRACGEPATDAARVARLPATDLLDIDELRGLCERFSALTGTVIAILDLAGSILIATGWQDMCTRFHRLNPDTACRCRESDTILANELAQGEAYHVYRCENGMVDVAMPIMVAGVHVANLYTGQFFFQPPDEDFFIGQAKRYGFDVPDYIAALRRVSVIPEERARKTMEYLSSLAQLFGETGLARTNLEEANQRLTRQIGDNQATLKALHASETKFRGMAENIPGVVYRMHVRGDGTSRFSYFSPHAEELFGGSAAADSTYVKLFAAMHDEDRAGFVESIQRAIAMRLPWNREGRLLMRDGSIKWIRGIASPAVIGDELVFDGVLLDITEEKRLEDRLLQAQKMETVGFLAGGVAHDLNNLLTPILGYAQMLKSGMPANDDSRTAVGQLIQAAERARDLTQRLLSFSHKQTIKPKVVNLGDVVRPFEVMLRRTIRENVSIGMRIAPPGGAVSVDPLQIEQVLLNLAMYAQDAMPRGGALTIEVDDVTIDGSGHDDAADVPPGQYSRLTVSDTGSGIDAAVRDHIFEPFYATKETGKGTGLGLSTVYGIVKRHGGTITVRSEKGAGSVFRAYFPRAAGSPARAAAVPRPKGGPARGTETVLVVDDNELVATVTGRMLENLGYRVLLAGNLDRSRELARGFEGDIHLLLTDVIMPRMNGRELYETLQPLRPRMKVVYMSGYTDDEIGKHGVLDEKTLLISKPFSVDDLAAILRAALDP
jgi:PAS domain S-box-containing protein